MEYLENDAGINCLIEKVNSKVKYEFKELIFEALNGNIDALKHISERMYCGILYNVSLFIPEVDAEVRKKYIFWLAKKVFKKNYLNKEFYMSFYEFIEWLKNMYFLIDEKYDELFGCE